MGFTSDDSMNSTEAFLNAFAIHHTSANLTIYDKNLRLVYSNPSAKLTTDDKSQSLKSRLVCQRLMKTIETSLETDGSLQIDAEVHTNEGIVWQSLDIRKRSIDGTSNLEDGYVVVTAFDITVQKNAEHQSKLLASTDLLTGLLNRKSIIQNIQKLISEFENKQQSFGLVFVDIDRFKVINESLGNAIGDNILVQVGKRLVDIFSNNELVSRVGGDQFVVVAPDISADKCLTDIAEAISDAIAIPMELNGQLFNLKCSCGISLYPVHGNTTAQLLRNAECAMYASKYSNQRSMIYNESMSQDFHVRMAVEQELDDAIKNQEFKVFYQPKISSLDGNVTGMEALIRWIHPQKGIVGPFDFIPVAEDTGQIVPIGNWVMLQGMMQQKKWAVAGNDVVVSINISPKQFQSEGLVDEITNALDISGCDPSKIELEITESMLLGDSNLVNSTLARITEMGIGLALDDFGKGYSNLAYLKKYPLNRLKIDRSFVSDTHHRNLLEMIINIGKTLNLIVVAEGVESPEEIEWLRQHFCDELQGFYFSKPVPVDDATAYLMDDTPRLPSGGFQQVA